jgi:DNA-binding CsgD family transcriptional regulator
MLNPQLLEASQRFTMKYGMTPREAQVFNLFLEGMTPETAAAHVGLSINTVRNYVKGMLRATQTNTISILLAKFIREVFERLPSPPQA